MSIRLIIRFQQKILHFTYRLWSVKKMMKRKVILSYRRHLLDLVFYLKDLMAERLLKKLLFYHLFSSKQIVLLLICFKNYRNKQLKF